MKAIFISTIIFIFFLFFISLGQSTACEHGCTPGFWKNHLEAWAKIGYSPDDYISDVFSSSDWSWPISPGALWELGNYTLLEALNFHGGRVVEGAARIMLRHAVAALLNDAHPDVDWIYNGEIIIKQ